MLSADQTKNSISSVLKTYYTDLLPCDNVPEIK